MEGSRAIVHSLSHFIPLRAIPNMEMDH